MKITLFLKTLILTISLGFAEPSIVSNAGTVFVSPVEEKTKSIDQEMEPGQLFSYKTFPELYCLALNIYHEARDEPLAGQLAVADVVLNRVEHTKYPNTICEVIKEGPVKESWKTRQTPDPNDAEYYPIKNKCQFSWYCDGKPDTIHEDEAWRKAQYYAYLILEQGAFRGISEGSTHYHADYVNPHWAPHFLFVGRIGTHFFYRQR